MSFALREVIKISVTVLRQCLLRMSKRPLIFASHLLQVECDDKGLCEAVEVGLIFALEVLWALL